MDNFNTHNHISGKFDTELESIHTKLTEMGKVVEKQLSLAIEAFATGNIEMAELVLQQDYVADEFEAVIDAQCVSTIALRHPYQALNSPG